MKILSSYKQFAKNLMFEEEGSELSDKEKEKAKKLNLVSLGWGKYGPKKGEPATHQNVDGKLVDLDKEKGGEEVPDSQKLSGTEFERPKDTKQDVDSDMYAQDTWDRHGDEEPSGEKQKVTEKPGETKQITAAGGNGVLLSKATVGHISAHNEPGEGSVFSDAMGEDELIKAVSEIPEDFFTTGDERGPGGIHTIETDHTVGYNLVEKAEDIKRKYPNAKKIMVNKQAGYDAEKGKPIMKPVPAYIIDNDIEEFGTKQMSVIARPSNPDRMDQELQDDPEVKGNMENKKSFSVLTAFPGDPDVPPAQNWEESGHAIIIPNGGKGADKTNWVEEPGEADDPYAEIEFDPSDPEGYSEKVKKQAERKTKALQYLKKKGMKVDYKRMSSDPEYAKKLYKAADEMMDFKKKVGESKYAFAEMFKKIGRR